MITVVASLWFAHAGFAETTVIVGTDASKVVLKGKMVSPDRTFDGDLVVEGDTITCVAEHCDTPSGASLVTVSNAFIFPGFIDAHNHVAYNILPKWHPPKLYARRGQWQASPSYSEFKKPYNDLKGPKKLFCEMVKYGEVKALLSGITTIQGTSPNSKCIGTLIRNAENQNELGTKASHIRTFILDIKSFKGSINWNVTKSFVVHLAEGRADDPASRGEFQTLKSKNLLTKQTGIIHGTAFGAQEFQEMAAVGAKLIWSPQSNLALYGVTTNVKVAREKGILVALGLDWNPTGSDNIFDELRVAARVNADTFGGTIPDSDWVKMVTENAAQVLALEDYIGKLAPGLKADITVLKAKDPEPAQSLLANALEDVEMVWVGGDLLYGDKSTVEAFAPATCEALSVHGVDKEICVKNAKNSVPKSNETFSEIRNALKAAYPALAPIVP